MEFVESEENHKNDETTIDQLARDVESTLIDTTSSKVGSGPVRKCF